MVAKLPDNITLSADKVKKILTIKIDYGKVVDYTSGKNKEVFGNLYMRKITDYFTLNVQLYGQIVEKDDVKEVKPKIKAEKFGM